MQMALKQSNSYISKSIDKPTKVQVSNHYQYGDSQTGFFAKMVPILMTFFVFFFVFLISGMALLKERTSGTLDRLLATPVRRSEIVYGYLISTLAGSEFQMMQFLPLVIVPQVFFSGIIPLDSMATWVQYIVKVWPLT